MTDDNCHLNEAINDQHQVAALKDETVIDLPEITVKELLIRARQRIDLGVCSLRGAAEDLSAAQDQGATQREIAKGVGKSVGWGNGLLSWRKRGYPHDTPFGPSSKESRQRAKAKGAQATERTEKTKKSRTGRGQDELAAAIVPVTKMLSAAHGSGDYHLPAGRNRQDPERSFQRLAEQWSSNPFRDLLLDSPKAAQGRFLRDLLLPELGGPRWSACRLLVKGGGDEE
jgi:hypothetical protein